MKNFKNWKPSSDSAKSGFAKKLSNLIKKNTSDTITAPKMHESNSGSGRVKFNNKVGSLIAKILLGLFFIVITLSALTYFFIIKPVIEYTDEVQKVGRTYNIVISSLVNDRDLVAYESNLAKLEVELSNLKKSRDSKLGHLRNLAFFSGYYKDVDHFIDSALILVGAGKEVRGIVEPFADAIGLKVTEDQVVSKVGLADAISSWVSVMPQIAVKIDPIIVKLAEAGQVLNKVDPEKYNINILGLYKNDLRPAIIFAQRSLNESINYGPDIKEALQVFPTILGVGTGERRYMVIMQNDAEIRATGGFWTNFATFKIRSAMLTSDFSSKDMYSVDITLDAIDAYTTFPTAPVAYNQFLKVERLYARDANISPDFPTAVERFKYFYNLAGQVNPAEFKPVDGYIGINTKVVEELIGITGAVNVNGITFSKENVVLELEKIASLQLAEQANRKKVLGDLMEAMLINVFESNNFLWPQLIEKGIDLMNRKQIVVYMNRPAEQKLFEKYGYAGRIKDPVDSDYSFFVSTNLGGDKTNMFVRRAISHDTSLSNGRVLRTTKVTYTYPRPTAIYNDFVKRYQDWFRFYVPAGSELVSLNGNEVQTVYQDSERGKIYFGGFMTLAPEETKVVEIKYLLPQSIALDEKYKILIQKQSGTPAEDYTFSVNGEIVESKSIDSDYTFEPFVN